MKAPSLWQCRNLKTELLFPVGVLYYAFQLLRSRFIKPESFGVPVLCIGNFTMGGAGKTPTAIAIATLLKEHFSSIAFVSRGYGGAMKGPVKVDIATHSAREVGDEPLLLSLHFPCYVAKKRAEGVREAIADGAKLIILDDGMQNPTIKKDCTLAVVDGMYGLGNHYLFPAGPLREPVNKGLDRADATVMIGPDITLLKDKLSAKKPFFTAQIEALESGFPRRDYLAFAGIGRPEKFFETLIRYGIYLRYTVSYPDHHHYTEADVALLKKRAEEFEANEFITTEKDYVRLPAEFAKEVKIFPITIKCNEEEALMALLLKKLGKK